MIFFWRFIDEKLLILHCRIGNENGVFENVFLKTKLYLNLFLKRIILKMTAHKKHHRFKCL